MCLLHPALPAPAGGQSAVFVLCVVCNSRDSAPASRLKDKQNSFPFNWLLIGQPTLTAPPLTAHTHTGPKHSCKMQPTNNRQTCRRNCKHTVWQVQRLIKGPSVRRRGACASGWHAGSEMLSKGLCPVRDGECVKCVIRAKEAGKAAKFQLLIHVPAAGEEGIIDI